LVFIVEIFTFISCDRSSLKQSQHFLERIVRWSRCNRTMRRTMATLAQTKGGIKDVQGVLGHSEADTTVNVYM
jgi:integrase